MFNKRRSTNIGASGNNDDSRKSKRQRIVNCGKILLDVAKECSDWFPPLKTALGVVSALVRHYEQYEDVKEKVEDLIPQLDRFKQHIAITTTGKDPEETNRRRELISAFKQIEDESAKLLEKSAAIRFTDKREDSKLVTALVERVRETIACYQISQQQAIYDQVTNLTLLLSTSLRLQEKHPVVREKLASVVRQLNRLQGAPWEGLQRERWTKLIDNITPIRDNAEELHERITTEGYTENEKDVASVSCLAEDLRSVLFEYWMAQQQEIYDQNCGLINDADLSVLNSCRRAKGAEYCHGHRRGCLKGTRDTVLNEIESWVNGSEKSAVFWLNGLAGTGKSTIAQTIAERLFMENSLGASFFCSRDFKDRRNLHFIFPTLAFQLARKYPDFRSHFVPLLRSNPDVVYESLYNQMQKLIAEPLCASCISTVMVIDALDECEDDEPSSAILSILGRFVEKLPRVKFFITGRPEPRIKTGFRLPLLVASTDVFVLHDVHPSLINSDIRLFLKHELSELAQRRRLGDWPGDKNIDLLCRRAAGLFVYAVATVMFLDNRTRLPAHQLDVILKLPESTVPEGKTRFDHKITLDSLYTSILQAAFDEDPEMDSSIRSTIGAIVLLVNPLSPSAIAELVRLDPEIVKLILELIQSLLAADEDLTQSVKPFHKSFPDFITNSSRCTNPRFCVSPEPLHIKLAANCLRVMNEELKWNPLSLPDYALNSEVKDLQTRVNNHISTTLQYACRSWHHHLTAAGGSGYIGIYPRLRTFLGEKFLEWLEVLSILGDVGGAIDALKELMVWLDEDKWALRPIAQDCFYFATKFFEPINISATHIYHSALELCPMSSIIRTLYYHRYNRVAHLPRVVVGVPDSWDLTVSVSGKGCDYGHCTWSPCGNFIAVQMRNAVEIRNQLTLHPLTILQPPETAPQLTGPLAYSPDGRSIACASNTAIVIWDIQTGGVVKEVGRGTGNISLVWSLDGRTICTIDREKEALGVHLYDFASGTTLSPGKLWSDVNPHLWACGEFFQIITTTRGYLACTAEIFEVGHSLIKTKSFRLEWDYPTAHPIISFSPTTSHVSVYADDALRIFEDWGSNCLLKESGHYSSHCFSSDGSLFGAFRMEAIHIWKYTRGGRYKSWRRLRCPNWANPSFQFSSPPESIMGRSGSVLQAWRLDGVAPAPKNDRVKCAGVSRSGNRIAIAGESEKTVTVINPHSEEPSQLIDTEFAIGAIVLTGNILLVAGLREVVAWRLAEDGLVHGVPSSRRADHSDSIWTVPVSGWVTLKVEDQVGEIESDESSCFIYHTETGESLPHEFPRQRSGACWNLSTRPLRGRDYFHCHNLPPPDSPPGGDYEGPQVLQLEQWVKNSEGQHRLWIPVEWREIWDRADWRPDARIQFSIIGGNPVIIKF